MVAESRFDRSEPRNTLFKNSERGRRITVGGPRFITGETKIFSLGSCFAVEIRRALRLKGLTVYPDYPSVALDPATQMAGRLPERDNINHYDTFVIRQEVERAIARRRWSESDFFALRQNRFSREKGWTSVFQDPYRRHIYSNSMPAVVDLSNKISACIDDGIAKADVIFLTFGLTECWRVKSNGLYAALGPDTERDPTFPLLEFRPTTFAENLDNLRATLNAIWSAFPDKRVLVTVSPVRLQRTWTGDDVISANLRSKATLLAAVGQIRDEYPRLIYWPSFEFSMLGDVYWLDGIHVRSDVVDQIVNSLLETYSV
jgi:hypothetical protein